MHCCSENHLPNLNDVFSFLFANQATLLSEQLRLFLNQMCLALVSLSELGVHLWTGNVCSVCKAYFCCLTILWWNRTPNHSMDWFDFQKSLETVSADIRSSLCVRPFTMWKEIIPNSQFRLEIRKIWTSVTLEITDWYWRTNPGGGTTAPFFSEDMIVTVPQLR